MTGGGNETAHGPSAPGGVLDIGADIGALVIYGTADIDGLEIENSATRHAIG